MTNQKRYQQVVFYILVAIVTILIPIVFIWWFSSLSIVGKLKVATSDQSMVLLPFCLVAILILGFSLIGIHYFLFENANRWVKVVMTGLFCLVWILSFMSWVNMFGTSSNFSSSNQVSTYLTGKKNAIYDANFEKAFSKNDTLNDHITPPRGKFAIKQVLVSTDGYDQIDGHTFRINGQTVEVPVDNKICHKNHFKNGEKKIVAVKYTWKKNTPDYVKAVYDQNFDSIRKNNTVTVYN